MTENAFKFARDGQVKPVGQWLNVVLHSDRDLDKIINEKISATIRNEHLEVRQNDNLLLVDFNYPAWIVLVDVTDVEYRTFETITESEWCSAGFDSQKNMFKRFKEIYHDFSPSKAATVITFGNPRCGSKEAANLAAK